MFISPKNVIVDFLRRRLVDPRSRAETSQTEEFDGGDTTFSLTPTAGTMSCITSVTVDDAAQIKWKDYYIDFQNQKVIFYSATGAGVNNVDITYKRGTSNWIYPDKSRTTLSKTAFPRINILLVSGSSERLGQYNSNMESALHYQVDIWTKENQKFTIDGVVYEGDKLSEYLGYQILKAFNENVDDLHPKLYNLTVLSTPRDLAFNQEMECFHHICEIELKGIDLEV